MAVHGGELQQEAGGAAFALSEAEQPQAHHHSAFCVCFQTSQTVGGSREAATAFSLKVICVYLVLFSRRFWFWNLGKVGKKIVFAA